MDTFSPIKSLRSLFSLLALFFLCAAPLAAQSVVNENSGQKYTDLQTAINAANSGDTLKISGTFTGPFVINKSLNIIGSRNAILDGGNAVRVLDIYSNGTIVVLLENLTVQNGLATSGGGIRSNAILTLNRVAVINNTATAQGGGGIANLAINPDNGDVGPGNLTILRSFINNNTGPIGGGVLAVGNGVGSVVIEESQISNNTATAGGGLSFTAVVSTIKNTLINNNSASDTGGGLDNFGEDATTLVGVKVVNNIALNGGGVHNVFAALTIKNSLIANNTARVSGGGLFNDTDGVLLVNDSKFILNSAAVQGGGIYDTGIETIVIDTDFIRNIPDDFFQ